MYVPRGKLLALIAFVLAASMVTATGAFTSVEAERTAEVKVAGDADAFLGLEAEDDNGYAKNDEGTLELYLSDEAEIEGSGKGVNPNAVTKIDNVFKIKNQGASEVTIELEPDPDEVTFYDSSGSEVNSIVGQEIGPGEEIPVGIEVDTTDHDYDGGEPESLIEDDQITITAKSDEPTGGTGDTGGDGGDSDE